MLNIVPNTFKILPEKYHKQVSRRRRDFKKEIIYETEKETNRHESNVWRALAVYRMDNLEQLYVLLQDYCYESKISAYRIKVTV